MVAFLAATPYQVLNCINIALSFHPNEERDIYIFLFATDLRAIAKQLQSTDVFTNVYVLEKFATVPGKIGIIKDFIIKDKQLKRCLSLATYDVLYITYIGDRCIEIYNQMLKKNSNLKLRFYDEGIGIYIVKMYESSANMRTLFQILKYRYVNNYVESIYVYQPSLMMSNTEFPTVKIPPIARGNEYLLTLLNSIFCIDLSKKEIENYPIVFLEQCFGKYLSYNNYRKMFRFDNEQLLDLLAQQFEVADILVKLHPITEITSYDGSVYQIAEQNGQPWEIMVYNTPNVENKLLATVNSTAALTPKLLFDEEPTILIMAKALHNSGLSDEIWNLNMEKLFSSFRNCYRNPEKVLIPSSMQELGEVLKNLRKTI